MKTRIIAAIVALGALTGGCATTYTNIRQVDDTHYLVTKVSQGFFSTSGTLLQCQASGENLACQRVGEP